jgi:hypothetical protein
MWIAPTLQYLPVRVAFRQRDSVAELALDRRPLQAAPAGAPGSSPASSPR